MTVEITVPTIPLDFEEYDPSRIDVWDEYVSIKDEKKRLTQAIMLSLIHI